MADNESASYKGAADEYPRPCKFCGNQIVMRKTPTGWRAYNVDNSLHSLSCSKDAYGSIAKSLARQERVEQEKEEQERLWRRFEAA